MTSSPIYDALLAEQDAETVETIEAARGAGIVTPSDARAAVLSAFDRTGAGVPESLGWY